MPTSKELNAAKRAKKDEFYTNLSDIENELQHYDKEHFRDKVIYCNCDDPRVSNFFHYFSYKFNQLGLKKLITTCYKSQQTDLFTRNDSENAIYLEYEGNKSENKTPDAEEIGIFPLEGDGDFRSKECVKLLKQADIVVTNPPFSLFREYVGQLIEYQKKFLIIGNLNATAYSEIFPLIQSNAIWLGPSIKSGDREFGVPDHYPLDAASCRIDNDGRKFIRVKGVRWFTNLEFKQRYEDLLLYKEYSEKEYFKFDNYDAINVDITNDIPMGYDGLMGVPISFLDKFNPRQYEILGITDRNSPFQTKVYTKKDSSSYSNWNRRGVVKIKNTLKPTYTRILIKEKQKNV